jgi:hypothetical protein
LPFRYLAVHPNPSGENRDHVEITGGRADNFGTSNVHEFRFLLNREFGLAS